MFAGWIYWIGLSDKATEGRFQWVNGEQASSTDRNLWRTGQPRGSHDCVVACFDKAEPEAREHRCSYNTGSLPGICEKPIS